MKFYSVLFLLLGCAMMLQAENLALGKTFKANYQPGKKSLSLLTDGKVASPEVSNDYQGHPETLFFDATYRKTGLVLDLDLGEVCGVDRITFSSFQRYGRGMVLLPFVVQMYLSDDGKNYRYYGNLAEDSAGITPDIGDAVQPFRVVMSSRELNGHGRYVKLIARSARFIACDEIEVLGSKTSGTNSGTAVKQLAASDADMTNVGIKRRYYIDLRKTVNLIESLPAADREGLLKEAETLKTRIAEYRFQGNPETVKLVVPYDALHEDIYALFGKAAAVKKLPAVSLWRSNEYSYLNQFVLPGRELPPISYHMMQNERRGATFNLFNATGEKQTVSFRIADIPAVTARLVETVDTSGNVLVAAALKDLTPVNGVYTITLPPGMTTQVWLDIDTAKLAQGTYKGEVRFDGAKLASLPLQFQVSKYRLPDTLTFQATLWDYTFNHAGGITKENVDAVAALLDKERISPWAYGQLPEKVDGAPYLESLDFMLEKMPNAPRYYIFYSLWPEHKDSRRNTFAGLKPGTPEFNDAVKIWAQKWQQELDKRGIPKGKVIFHLHDEPNTVKQIQFLTDWAAAVRAGAPGISIICNPPHSYNKDMLAATEKALQYCDIFMPRFARYFLVKDGWPELQKNFQANGGELQYYDCAGPTRLFDPDYYRMLAWYGARDNATGMAFWRLQAPVSWNNYLSLSNLWPVIFLNPDSVQGAKPFEALREGRIDFEYIKILRGKIQELRAASRPQDADRAQAFLDQVISDVLTAQSKRPVAGTYYHEFWYDDISMCPLLNQSREKILNYLEKIK